MRATFSLPQDAMSNPSPISEQVGHQVHACVTGVIQAGETNPPFSVFSSEKCV